MDSCWWWWHSEDSCVDNGWITANVIPEANRSATGRLGSNKFQSSWYLSVAMEENFHHILFIDKRFEMADRDWLYWRNFLETHGEWEMSAVKCFYWIEDGQIAVGGWIGVYSFVPIWFDGILPFNGGLLLPSVFDGAQNDCQAEFYYRDLPFRPFNLIV